MTISDANPVQFWTPDQETFNEKEVDGIFQRCFCSPWNCDDEITTQFQEVSGSTDYSLVAINESNIALHSQLFQEILSGVYQTTFIPSVEGICDETVALLIVDLEDVEALRAPSAWDDDFNGTPFSSANSTTFTYTDPSTPATGADARQSLVIPAGVTIQFDVIIVTSGTYSGLGANYFFSLTDASNNDLVTQSESGLAPGTYNRTIILTAPSVTTYLKLNVGVVSSPGQSFTITVQIPTGQVFIADPGSSLAKSDCLEIAESYNETILIEYSSNRNFAGLNYSNITPDPSFFLRVPAIFFRQRFPQEKETIELSNSRSIQLSAQVKAQKHLQVKNMPDYMHRKLLLALSHQFVTIDGQDWVLSEEYELIPPSNPRWPMQKAQCWLTEKDYIMRSVL